MKDDPNDHNMALIAAPGSSQESWQVRHEFALTEDPRNAFNPQALEVDRYLHFRPTPTPYWGDHKPSETKKEAFLDLNFGDSVPSFFLEGLGKLPGKGLPGPWWGGGDVRHPINRPRRRPAFRCKSWIAMMLAFFLLAGCLEPDRRGMGLVASLTSDYGSKWHWVEFATVLGKVRVFFEGSGASGGWINLNCEEPSDFGNNPDWWMRITVYRGDDRNVPAGDPLPGPPLDRQNVTRLLCPSSVLIKVDSSGRFTVVPDDNDYDGKPLPTGVRE
jgi:hypothetical protein